MHKKHDTKKTITTKSLKSYKEKPSNYMDNIKTITNKGYYEILLLIQDNHNIRYGSLLSYTTQNKIASESYFLKSINNLTELNLIKRKTLQTKPAGTSYSLTKKGSHAIHKINELARYLMDG